MAYLRNLAMAGAAALALAPTVAKAADMPLPPPPMPFVEEVGGWYLRGDLGMSNQYVKRITSPVFTPDVTVLDKGFDSAPTFGVGLGYQFNNWFRMDVTTEYRGGATFRGMDRYVDGTLPTGFGTNDYYGTKTEWLTLVNAYVDLGSWYSITPYVGAGIGGSRNTISNWRDNNIATTASAYAKSHSEWDLAWALYAGVSYKVTPSFAVDFGYRYTNLGDARSGDMIGFDGTNSVYNPIEFKNIYSHDFRIGARWLLADGFMPAPYSEPLIRKY